MRRLLPLAAMLATIVLVASSLPARAASGDPDPSFSTNGYAESDPSGLQTIFWDVALQKKEIATCGFAGNGGVVERYRPGGSLDRRFSGDGIERLTLPSKFTASGCAFLSDGRLVVAGYEQLANTHYVAAILMVKPGGGLDRRFANAGVRVVHVRGWANTLAYDVTVQPNDRILVAGEVYGGTKGEFVAMRLLDNGTLDRTFSRDGLALVNLSPLDDGAGRIVRQADGAIVLVGWTYVGADPSTGVVRLTTSGKRDRTFSGDGRWSRDLAPGSSDSASGVAQAPNGDLIVGAYGSGGSDTGFVVDLTPKGRLRRTFDGDGIATAPGFSVADVAVQRDGKAVVFGTDNNSAEPAVRRLTRTGTDDSSFGTGGLASLSLTGEFNAGAIDAQGRLVAAGDEQDQYGLVARFLP